MNRLPAQIIAALLASTLLVATAAQGLVFMRCGASVEIRASCCCQTDGPRTQARQVVQPAGASCDRLTVPTAQAQQAEQRSGAPVPVSLAVTVVPQPLALVMALREEQRAPGLDPPPAPSPLLASCAFLI